MFKLLYCSNFASEKNSAPTFPTFDFNKVAKRDHMTQKVLSKPFINGNLKLPNRFVMAPLTRQRAGQGLAPTQMNATYYAQRAAAGLIVSEASQISPRGMGYPNTPGIYSRQQIEGWKLVTEAVHNKGGRIYCQLWHVGRHSHPLLQEDGGLPVAPSAVKETGHVTTHLGKMEPVVPHALSLAEIKQTIEHYHKAALNAIEAGFDGVEIHGANGYLIDQFLNDYANIREDEYGSSLENKCRFGLEVTKAVTDAIGSHRTGIRLSPSGTNFGILNHDPVGTFTYLIEQLNQFNLAYLHLIEPRHESLVELPQYLKNITPFFRKIYEGTLITSAGYNFESAGQMIDSGLADLVAFGKLFIANPDLPSRYAKNAPLNEWDTTTFYGGDEKGYTDYPFLNDS
jgi:N-ethylmaleimide reductase